MSSFFTYVKPNIIKHDDTFYVNYDLINIGDVLNNYTLLESSAMMMQHNIDHYIIDIPRIYIKLTEDFIKNPNNFQEFISNVFVNDSIIKEGTDSFKIGIDYCVNETIANLYDISDANEDNMLVLEDYLIFSNNRIKLNPIWNGEDISVYSEYNSLQYYFNKNKMNTYEFTEDELDNFYKTFCGIILEKTTFDKPQPTEGPTEEPTIPPTEPPVTKFEVFYSTNDINSSTSTPEDCGGVECTVLTGAYMEANSTTYLYSHREIDSFVLDGMFPVEPSAVLDSITLYEDSYEYYKYAFEMGNTPGNIKWIYKNI